MGLSDLTEATRGFGISRAFSPALLGANCINLLSIPRPRFEKESVKTLRLRLLSAVALGGLALLGTPILIQANASPDPTACPISSWPSNVASLPWVQTSYQSQFTPEQLAEQVVNCEETLHPSNTLPAEIALTTLRYVTGTQWQNQNNWLTVTGPSYVYIPDFNQLGIPSITLEDGPTGIRYQKSAAANLPTTFPNEMALAATMDPTVAQAYGDQLGLEGSLMNYQGIQAPDLNIARIPTWGRLSESFGENPTLAGLMGRAELSTLINREPFVVLKHFGAYGQENSRRTINQILSEKALYDNYLRPFAIARSGADSALANGRNHDVLLMCSYGDINGTQSCASKALATALSNFGFTGLVRSDLDVRAGTGMLYGSSVSLIKPQIALSIAQMNALSAKTKQGIHDAAVNVVTEMFRTSLVTPTGVTDLNTGSQLSSAMHNQGVAVANAVERRAAVLLKNSNSAFPLSKSGSTAILTAQDLNGTCRTLAAALTSQGYASRCTILNPPLSGGMKPFGPLSGGGKTTRVAQAHWVAPRAGYYIFQLQTTGNSQLKVNGVPTITVGGTTEFPYPNFVSFHAEAGQSFNLNLTWSQKAPNFMIGSLANVLATTQAAVASASRVLVLANDVGREGADRSTLELPYGFDSIIKYAASLKPTSVALFTTGPVTMPWIGSVNGVFEFWNGTGDTTADTAITRLVPAIGDLLTGVTVPTGHLPITFPQSTALSPSGLGNAQFWPGINGVARLDKAPQSGLSLGFNWYQSAGWPVLFPFGYGLTYPTSDTTFALNAPNCDTTTATSICFSLKPRAAMSDSVKNFTNVAQLYVAPPSGLGLPRLSLGTVVATTCRTTSGASTTNSAQCSTGTVNAVVTATQSGSWNATSDQYEFGNGCYTFILASDARDAFDALANPTKPAHADHIIHANAPFNSSTSFSAGAC